MSLAETALQDLSVENGTRPSAPDLPQATQAHRKKGRRLAAIHRHYLMDLARIAAVLDRIKAGNSPPAELKDIVLSLDMAQNFRAFGSLCGQECRVLTMHHDIEQHHMFPTLENSEVPGIVAVVARLRQEHEVVHELIKRLDQAADDLMQTGAEPEFAAAGAVFEKLLAVVQSHFKYEETELEAAIGLFVKQI